MLDELQKLKTENEALKRELALREDTLSCEFCPAHITIRTGQMPAGWIELDGLVFCPIDAPMTANFGRRVMQAIA